MCCWAHVRSTKFEKTHITQPSHMSSGACAKPKIVFEGSYGVGSEYRLLTTINHPVGDLCSTALGDRRIRNGLPSNGQIRCSHGSLFAGVLRLKISDDLIYVRWMKLGVCDSCAACQRIAGGVTKTWKPSIHVADLRIQQSGIGKNNVWICASGIYFLTTSKACGLIIGISLNICASL
jgi:hypothetical protein